MKNSQNKLWFSQSLLHGQNVSGTSKIYSTKYSFLCAVEITTKQKRSFKRAVQVIIVLNTLKI